MHKTQTQDGQTGSPIAILVKQFPKLSETFVLGEVASLTDHGVDLRIFSMSEPSEAIQQPDAARFLEPVTYLCRTSRMRAYFALFVSLLRKPMRIIAFLRIAKRNRELLHTLGAILAASQSNRISHIHAHYISEPAALADAAASMRSSMTFSVSAHAKDIYLTPADEIAERLNNALFVATCTRHNYQYLRNLTPTNRYRVYLVYHGIDTEHFAPKHKPDSQQPPLILSVGRFKEKKGFDLLIKACAKLAATHTPFQCDIIGYGDQEQHLKSLISSHVLNHFVRLRSAVAHSELRDIFHTADIFTLPCRITSDGDRDGIPNSMLEAMASGVPIVSTPVSGIPEVIREGVNGLLIEPENVGAIAKAIQTLLDDPALRSKLGSSGRDTVLQHFSWEQNILPLIQLLQPRLYKNP